MSFPNSPLPMDNEGPPLEVLLHRITEIPDDFLAAANPTHPGSAAIGAIVYDVADTLGVTLSAEVLKELAGTDPKKEAARISLTLLLCWLLSDEWFRTAKLPANRFTSLLSGVAAELSVQGSATKYVNDPERREEVSRLTLAHFGYRPAGESKAQAQDRLTSLSGVERARVLRASRDAEERSRAIREALVKKAADEAADKWTRE